jgi:hypothetical protein
MTEEPARLLSDDSLKTIAAVATSSGDIKAVFASVGIPFAHAEMPTDRDILYIPGIASHVRASLKALDLTDPSEVGRILRAIPQIVEFYEASDKADRTKLVRLKMALEADGFPVGQTNDFATAFGNLAISANGALADITGIRAEISRLEKALPDDPGAAIGRAKNLVEATAKAVLAHRGVIVNNDDKLPALAAKAVEELGIHPRQVPAQPEQVKRLLSRLQGIVQDLAELRNNVGDGHGSVTIPQELDSRHGRLAVWSALGWCSYLLETLSRGSSGSIEPGKTYE